MEIVDQTPMLLAQVGALMALATTAPLSLPLMTSGLGGLLLIFIA